MAYRQPPYIAGMPSASMQKPVVLCCALLILSYYIQYPNRELLMSKPKNPETFNSPFASLKQQLQEKQPVEAVKSKEIIMPSVSTTSPDPPLAAIDEDQLFAKAMQGVAELDDKGGRQVAIKKPARRPVIATLNEDLEVVARLAELVAGEEEICISWQRDFVRGATNNVNVKLLELLEAGQFPIQDYLDLHGLGVEEAMLAVEKFLRQSRERGLRHVLLVHGKGRGSVGGESILKENLIKRLGHKRFARWVLAFCSAAASDGGTGAMYVLLKTWQGPTIFREKAGK